MTGLLVTIQERDKRMIKINRIPPPSDSKDELRGWLKNKGVDLMLT